MFAKDHPSLTEKRYLSSGNPALDRALGGGFRRGVPHMIWGAEGMGKSTIGLMTIKEALETHNTCCLISTESPQFPIDQAEAAGMTREQMDQVLFIPAYGAAENLLNIVKDTLYDSDRGVPRYLLDVIVIDSIAALIPNAVVTSIEDKGFEGSTMARLAALTSKFYPYIVNVLSPDGILLSINQKRTFIGQSYTKDIPPGGNAVLFYNKTSTKITPDSKGMAELTKQIKTPSGTKTQRIGNSVKFEVVKNNAGGRPGANGTFRYYFGKGLDVVTPVVEEALDMGVMKKASPTSNIHILVKPDGTEERVNGRQATIEYLEKNPDIYLALKALVYSERLKATLDTPDIVEETEEVAIEEVEEGVVVMDEDSPFSDE
jgi:RecA/RadA recombinase